MRSRNQRFMPATTGHTFRLELSLDFAGQVNGEQARQTARRLLESLRIEAGQVTESLQGCRLTCHDLHQTLTLVPAAPQADDRAD